MRCTVNVHSLMGYVSFMSSGPVLAQVLEGENAIAMNRQIMGATNPKEAAAGTVRADFCRFH